MSDVDLFEMLPDDLETHFPADDGDLNDELSLSDFMDTLMHERPPLDDRYLTEVLVKVRTTDTKAKDRLHDQTAGIELMKSQVVEEGGERLNEVDRDLEKEFEKK